MQHTGEEQIVRRRGRALWVGVAWWLVFGVVVVAVRGVRWDENYEFAQVILGQMGYPDWHPLVRYTGRLYSLQTWTLAAWMHFAPGPLLANALRNVLFMWATVLPPFLLAAGLSRRALFGHGAALLVLLGAHTPFYSNYPAAVWPGLYSNGHIGLGWALLTLWFIAAGHARPGYLLAGLMPAVHLGQFPPVLLLAAARLVWAVWTGRRPEWCNALVWGGAGVFFAAGFWVWLHTGAPPGEAPPWIPDIAPDTVLHGYLEHHASHRRLPDVTAHILVVGTLLLALPFGRQARRTEGMRDPAAWVAAYALATGGLVWLIATVHQYLGGHTPPLLLAWMPYRLVNHLGPLLVVIALAALARRAPHRVGPAALLALLAFALARPLLALTLPAEWYARYLGSSELLLYGLYGMALSAMLVLGGASGFRRAWVLLSLAVLLAIAAEHQFGAACAAAGAGLMTFLARYEPAGWPERDPHLRRWSKWTVVCGGALAAMLAGHQAAQRVHLPVTAFQREVRAFLAEHNAPARLVLVRHQQEGLQARLRQPVMTDMATMTWIPYRPDLGPTLYQMYRDLYGINLAPRPRERTHTMPWFEVWPGKTAAEWRALSERYGFDYVQAPAFMELELEPVLKGRTDVLYQVPGAREPRPK